MILDYIELVRAQPADIRRRIVGLWTAVIVVGIVVLYLLILAIQTWVFTDAAKEESLLIAPYQGVQQP